MKTWLTTFTAVLVAGALLFFWHRGIILWESNAAKHAEQLDRVVHRIAEYQKMGLDPRAAVVALENEAVILQSNLVVAQRHLSSFAPLRDENTLIKALSSAHWANQHIKDELKEQVALNKQAEEIHAKTVEGWTEIAAQHVETLQNIKASLPFLHGDTLNAKKLELATAISLAEKHLKIAPSWSDTEPLIKTLKSVSK